MPSWIKRIESGRTELLELDRSTATAITTLRTVEREAPDKVLRLAIRRGNELQLRVTDEEPAEDSRLVLLVSDTSVAEQLRPHAAAKPEAANQQADGSPVSAAQCPLSIEEQHPQGQPPVEQQEQSQPDKTAIEPGAEAID